MRQFTLCISEFIQGKKKCARRARFFFGFARKRGFERETVRKTKFFDSLKRTNQTVRPLLLLKLRNRSADCGILLLHSVEQAPVLERLIASHGLGQHSADLIQPLKAKVLRYALEGMRTAEGNFPVLL